MTLTASRLAETTRFMRFCAVGAAGFCTDAGVLFGLLSVFPDRFLAARLISIGTALTLTWALNRRHTFGSSDPRRLAEWSRFAGINACGAALNFTLYAALLHSWPWLSPLLALAAGSALALIFNYLGTRQFVFAQNHSGSP